MKVFRYFLPLFLTVFLTYGVRAQQLPAFVQNGQQQEFINPASLHPAFVLHDYRLRATLSHRRQWTRQGTPTTSLLNVNYRIRPLDRWGLILGSHVLSDRNGPVGQDALYARVAVAIGNPEKWGLAGGLHFGYGQHRINTTEIAFLDQGDILADRMLSQGLFDVGVGLYTFRRLAGPNELIFLGLSIPQVLGLDLTYREWEGRFEQQRVQHLYATAGIRGATYGTGYLEVTGWGKYVTGAPFHLDINIRHKFPQPFWVGLGGSSAGAVHAEAGVFVGAPGTEGNNTLRIGYGFSEYFSNAGPFFGGSHELNLSWLMR